MSIYVYIHVYIYIYVYTYTRRRDPPPKGCPGRPEVQPGAALPEADQARSLNQNTSNDNTYYILINT